MLLTDAQQLVVDRLRSDGIALVPFQDLFPEETWRTLAEGVSDWAEEVAGRTDELLARDDDKAYLARRFLARRTGESKQRRWKFALDDPWLRLGLSDSMLGIVNAYRGERTRLIDIDNWYTIPDPTAEDRIESQCWHRDAWDNHIVKVFVYFNDVDPEAGPFEYVRGSPQGGRYGDLWPWAVEGVYPPQEEVEAAIDDADRLTITGPAGTVIFCDTSGLHRGGWARSRPRILSYHTFVGAQASKSPRFRVSWDEESPGLSPDAEHAIAWSKRKKTAA